MAKSSSKPLRIANGAGFLGDNLDAPRLLVEAAEVDYLTLEYLAELTLSILARKREKNPAEGYADDFVDVLASLRPALRAQSQLRLVTNAGGVNVSACACAAAQQLVEGQLAETVIGLVSGDDIVDRLPAWQAAGERFENVDTGEPLGELAARVVSANVYLGARPIAEALAGGARIVITGRVADASLTVGPAMCEFGWAWEDWSRLAGASVAGHLIECAAQVTGGYSLDWQGQNLAHVGYPIAEIDSDASCVITKPPGSGGRVTRETVVEQLVYEIGDPAHYLTPDVDVDFTSVDVTALGPDRVAVHGATGRPAPAKLKASLAYWAGYAASGQLLVYGKDCVAKARACAEMIRSRLASAGCRFDAFYVELLGAGDSLPGLHAPPEGLRELSLRIAARSPDRNIVERFTKEFAPLVTSGPAGLAGYASGRSPVRPVLAYWPTLVPRERVAPEIELRTARDWLAEEGRAAAAPVPPPDRSPSRSPDRSSNPGAHMPTISIPLGFVARARSGDKGNHANIGVVASGVAGFAYLQRELTAERVAEYFRTLGPTRVVRYELPRVGALNFVLYDVLAGGASQSLRLDTQGKLLGAAILDLELPAPSDPAVMAETLQNSPAATSAAGHST